MLLMLLEEGFYTTLEGYLGQVGRLFSRKSLSGQQNIWLHTVYKDLLLTGIDFLSCYNFARSSKSFKNDAIFLFCYLNLQLY